MIAPRRSNERGHANHGWLDSYHTFSFADYYDRSFMGFRDLRVINEDRVAGGSGFPTHPHREMEILTYVMSGALAHQDSMGSKEVIKPGDFQLMSAGTGVTHSEFNGSEDERVHLLQIWIMPSVANTAPTYNQRNIPQAEKENQFCLVVSPDGTDRSMKILQDASVYVSALTSGSKLKFNAETDRYYWIQVCSGELTVNNSPLAAGDGAAVQQERELNITSVTGSEFLLFDLN